MTKPQAHLRGEGHYVRFDCYVGTHYKVRPALERLAQHLEQILATTAACDRVTHGGVLDREAAADSARAAGDDNNLLLCAYG